MLIPIRKTFTGHIEYWDTEKKLVLIGGVDLSNDVEPDEINFSEMTVAQLKEYAKQNNIELPDNAKKADIIKLLS